MGNANNLPFDILPFIFHSLCRSDLVAAALVNTTFASGALPKLYEHIIIRLSFVKRIDSVRGSIQSRRLAWKTPAFLIICAGDITV